MINDVNMYINKTYKIIKSITRLLTNFKIKNSKQIIEQMKINYILKS